MQKRTVVAAITGVAIFATAAFAATNLNPDGTGFAGKGDIQVPFGWNDATLQKEAKAVAFTYVSQETYDLVCAKTIETRRETRIVRVERESTSSVNADVIYDTRKNSKDKVTGFNLNGFANTVTVEGTGCNSGEDEESRQLDSSSTTLTASHSSTLPAVIWQNGASTL